MEGNTVSDYRSRCSTERSIPIRRLPLPSPVEPGPHGPTSGLDRPGDPGLARRARSDRARGRPARLLAPRALAPAWGARRVEELELGRPPTQDRLRDELAAREAHH